MDEQIPIHKSAAKGFQTAADAYERGRPEYPKDAVEALVNALGIDSGSTVIDLGAGTGKFTRLLIPSKARIIAIEPVEGMRQKFSSLLPKIEMLSGTAESMPVSDNSVDAVIVAQAFHWFNGPSALTEIHRVLKPGGKLGLIWNARDESVDWFKKITEIYDGYEKGTPQYRHGTWKNAFKATSLFEPLQEKHFQYVQGGTIETVVDRILSISFIAALPEVEQSRIADKIRTLIETHPLTRGKERIEIPYRTDIFWSDRK